MKIKPGGTKNVTPDWALNKYMVEAGVDEHGFKLYESRHNDTIKEDGRDYNQIHVIPSGIITDYPTWMRCHSKGSNKLNKEWANKRTRCQIILQHPNAYLHTSFDWRLATDLPALKEQVFAFFEKYLVEIEQK